MSPMTPMVRLPGCPGTVEVQSFHQTKHGFRQQKRGIRQQELCDFDGLIADLAQLMDMGKLGIMMDG